MGLVSCDIVVVIENITLFFKNIGIGISLLRAESKREWICSKRPTSVTRSTTDALQIVWISLEKLVLYHRTVNRRNSNGSSTGRSATNEVLDLVTTVFIHCLWYLLPQPGGKGGGGVNNQFSSSVGIVDIVQRFGGSIDWLMNIIICSSFSCGTREPQSTVVRLFYCCYLTLSM